MLGGTPAHADGRVDASTLSGKLILGFQGWFNCPDDGAGLGWGHWAVGNNVAVDLLPDMTDFPPNAVCATNMHTARNGDVQLFSDVNKQAVETQFAWMAQNGLDGVALQRFAGILLKPQILKARNTVLANVRQAAEDHGRVFFVMYDLTGMPSADLPMVVSDWQHLESQGLTRSPAYLHHRGHPLLAVWGLGFPGRQLTPGQAANLLAGLQQVSAPYGGVTLLGGVPSYWRTGTMDASSDPGWKSIWPMLGVISPWSVGRYNDAQGADAYLASVTIPDLAFTRQLGIDYMPVIFPGYAHRNAHVLAQPNAAPPPITPRQCGAFYWLQVSNALGAGSTMLYNAMFDEVNEGDVDVQNHRKPGG